MAQNRINVRTKGVDMDRKMSQRFRIGGGAVGKGKATTLFSENEYVMKLLRTNERRKECLSGKSFSTDPVREARLSGSY